MHDHFAVCHTAAIERITAAALAQISTISDNSVAVRAAAAAAAAVSVAAVAVVAIAAYLF
jgi:hypothetical protein